MVNPVSGAPLPDPKPPCPPCTLPGKLGGQGVLSPWHWQTDPGAELRSALRLGTEPGTRSPWQPYMSSGPSAMARPLTQRSTVPPTPAQLSLLQSKQPRDPTLRVASMGFIVQEALWLDPSPPSGRTASSERGLPCPLLSLRWPPWGSLWGRGPAECDLLSSGWI